MLLQRCKDSGTPDEGEVEVFRDGSMLMNRDGQPILRLRASLGLEAAHRDIQIGFPILLDENSPTRFELLREWLRTCDSQHKCFPQSSQLPQLPTRVLEVLDHQNPDLLRLRCTNQGDTGKYVALSHRWSDLDNFCTYQCNIHARQTSIDFKILPKRFRDAVTVTRKFGIRFLWIDSICIIQPHKKGSDECPNRCRGTDDVDHEIGKMEEYFGSAYCTIAATSVTHRQVNEGFLERRSDVHWVKVSDASESLYDDSNAIDNFHRDVEGAELNKRGWVLQERALSRRTIHFTSTQAYWECGGDGIRCETLTTMRNQTAQLLSDHEFPNFVLGHFEGNKILLFGWLFEQYSKCELTVPTDRLFAISGLEKRLQKSFGTEGRYGIFARYLHRCLLWQPPDGKEMKRIRPDSDYLKVPSWSWMAYTGEITYMKIPFEEVEWSNAVKCFPDIPSKLELQAPVREFLHCTIEPQNQTTKYAIFAEGDERGWLKFDVEEASQRDDAPAGRTIRDRRLRPPRCFLYQSNQTVVHHAAPFQPANPGKGRNRR